MDHPVLLLDRELEGLAEAAGVRSLGAEHPLWAADVAALDPQPLGASATPPGAVLVCGDCASTMDVARALVAEGRLAPWGSVVAPRQRAGRGQLRREWLSRPGNLLATLVCPPAPGPWNDLRPLVLGHLFAQELARLGDAVEVKWPNDILCGDRKVAGMLVEERPGCVLAGIGLNLAWAPEPGDLREGRSVDAGEFIPHDEGVGPLRLWRALVMRVETEYISLLEAFSPSDFLAIFRTRMAWQGRRVLVSEGAALRYEAVVRGISAEGGLVLDRAGHEVVLLAGDVTPV